MSMKVAAIAIAALGLVAAGQAGAAERASDLDYMKANRCKGLAETLGSVDTAGLDTYLKAQKKGRQSFVLERGESEFDKARREAKSPDRKDRLNAELTGACMAYMGPDKAVAVR
ncbi:hypothetical protein [Phenylobacterium sp. J367]|uniref:hypothetical protein n=1 Tax=Phenylobacterium sp. J367 TaxID=2898435 RepID=UPI00215169D2|nr:hypothetical protein [Phenylobacterium sp. J367]MCR5881009.1 hypothetical protein [Phenylobacterium sp. J367]